MAEFFGAGENVAFVVALVIMILIGLIELVGLGSSVIGHDLDLHADGDWLGWLGIGRLPLLILFVLFLCIFATIGLIGQQLALDMLGHLVPAWAAAPSAAAAALPLTGLLSRPIAHILPHDETTAIDVAGLVGLRGHIVVGRASVGSPAKTRVRDPHGHAHYVMVEPADPELSFSEGDEVLLVSRDHHVFRAVACDRPAFSDWIAR